MGVLSSLLSSLTGVSPASTTANNNNNNNNSPPPTIAPVSAPAATVPPLQQPSSPTTPQQDSSPPPPTDYYNHYFSARSLRQLSLFLGGAGFFYLSIMVSRRAAARHRLASRLKYYEPNNQAAGWGFLRDPEVLSGMPKQKDPVVALEALNLATLNTMAFAVMAAGGVSWGLDISNLDDLKRYARRTIVQGAPGGERDEAAEQEVAEWMINTFGIAEKNAVDGQGEGGKGKAGAEGEKKG